jgi:hypothetical protein
MFVVLRTRARHSATVTFKATAATVTRPIYPSHHGVKYQTINFSSQVRLHESTISPHRTGLDAMADKRCEHEEEEHCCSEKEYLSYQDEAEEEEEHSTIYINNSCGKVFFFHDVPADRVEEWFENNDVETIVSNNLSSCEWGCACDFDQYKQDEREEHPETVDSWQYQTGFIKT